MLFEVEIVKSLRNVQHKLVEKTLTAWNTSAVFTKWNTGSLSFTQR